MQKLPEVIQKYNVNDTLIRRSRMFSSIEEAIHDDQESVKDLLAAILLAYEKGSIRRFWDLLAVLSGNQRGFGNDWLFTALELLKRMEGHP